MVLSALEYLSNLVVSKWDALAGENFATIATTPLNSSALLEIDLLVSKPGRGRMVHEAVELEPDNPMFQECLGSYLIQSGEFQGGIQALERALQLQPSFIFDHSLPNVDKMVSQALDNPLFNYGLACVFDLAGMSDEAKEYRERAFRLNIHGTLYMAGLYNEAERTSRQFLESDPENSGAWLILGGVQNEKKLWSEAEASFRKVLDIENDYPHAWLGLATSLMHQKRFEEAQEAKKMADKYEGNTED